MEEAGQSSEQHADTHIHLNTHNNTDKPVVTYQQCVQLTLDSKTPPSLTLKVHGVNVTFLVDSGAEVSVIQSKILPNAPRTTKLLKTIGASGIPGFEPISEPLTVWFGDYKGEHPFLLSDVCPVNLLGRDLMCALSIEVHCDPAGIKLTCATAGLYPFCISKSDYHYSWDLVKPCEIDKLLCMIPPVSESPDCLQCVLHISSGTRNYTYEEIWNEAQENDTIKIERIFVGSEFAAASVCVSESQQKLFMTLGSVPYIILAKSSDINWMTIKQLQRLWIGKTDQMVAYTLIH